MSLFRTILHLTDFDERSKEAFRVARSLVQAVGARVVAVHVISPPAIVNHDGRVIQDPRTPEPVDLWAEYRALTAEVPAVPVE
jgi:nucleotide-binding universal stress UspA family protein